MGRAEEKGPVKEKRELQKDERGSPQKKTVDEEEKEGE